MAGRTKTIGTDLTTGPIFRKLIIFVGPILAADLIQQLYSLVDLMVIGQFMGSTGTVGVSTGGEFADMVMPVATAFGAAGQIYVGQLIGSGNREGSKKAIGTLLGMMIGLSLVLTVLVILLRSELLVLLNCPEEAFTQATNYLVITALGYPFIFGYNAVTGILRGMGESQKPMLFIIVAAIVNVFLDLLLVGPLHMEAAGTAIATVMSQCASFAAAAVYMYRQREALSFEWKLSELRIDRDCAGIILKLGIPQAIRSLLVRVSMLYVNSCVNAYGLVESATNSVGNKLQKFLEIYTTSFSQAASSMVAQNLGAKKYERAAKTILYSFYVCTLLSGVMTVVILTVPKLVFGLFTTDAEVLDMGVIYLRILIIHLFLSALTSTFQAMVIGSGFASLNFVIGVLDGVIFKVGLGILLARVAGMGVYGYWWGTAFSRLVPGIIVVGYYLSGNWKKRSLVHRQ